MKKILLLFLGLLIVSLGLLAYYFFLKEPAVFNNLGIFKNNALEKILSEQVYKGKSFKEGTVPLDAITHAYGLMGITDGVAIEEPYQIKADSGELLATNELSFRLFYLDDKAKLQSVLVALVVKLPDGSSFVSTGIGNHIRDLAKAQYKEDPTMDQIKMFLRSKFENLPGRIVDIRYWVTLEDLARLPAAQPGSDIDITRQFTKKDITGRQAGYKKLVETGDPGIGVILSNVVTSTFLGGQPQMVQLNNVTFPKVRVPGK